MVVCNLAIHKAKKWIIGKIDVRNPRNIGKISIFAENHILISTLYTPFKRLSTDTFQLMVKSDWLSLFFFFLQ